LKITVIPYKMALAETLNDQSKSPNLKNNEKFGRGKVYF
jgi:hypothetical protein